MFKAIGLNEISRVEKTEKQLESSNVRQTGRVGISWENTVQKERVESLSHSLSSGNRVPSSPD